MAAKSSEVELSAFAKRVKAWYDAGIWKEYMVRNAVAKGRITQEECDCILGGD